MTGCTAWVMEDRFYLFREVACHNRVREHVRRHEIHVRPRPARQSHSRTRGFPERDVQVPSVLEWEESLVASVEINAETDLALWAAERKTIAFEQASPI